MKKVIMTKQQIFNAFNEGKVIRKTSGVWNTPNKDGVIVTSIDQLEKFYDWAYLVAVYESDANGIDYDLIGASGGDMF